MVAITAMQYQMCLILIYLCHNQTYLQTSSLLVGSLHPGNECMSVSAKVVAVLRRTWRSLRWRCGQPRSCQCFSLHQPQWLRLCWNGHSRSKFPGSLPWLLLLLQLQLTQCQTSSLRHISSKTSFMHWMINTATSKAGPIRQSIVHSCYCIRLTLSREAVLRTSMCVMAFCNSWIVLLGMKFCYNSTPILRWHFTRFFNASLGVHSLSHSQSSHWTSESPEQFLQFVSQVWVNILNSHNLHNKNFKLANTRCDGILQVVQ